MPIETQTASDSTYHSRHLSRTLGRAKKIANDISEIGSVLDVGCNNGITSRYLLESGKARTVTGIELKAETVDQDLCWQDNFELIEGNIVELELDQKYDYIVYGAVHHHILNLYGLSAAIRTLQKLVSNCNRSLYFETGQIGEGGRWEWQRAMRQYFRTDEEHIFYLLRSIEHSIEGFEVIGSFWIHGIRRHYLRIDIKAPAIQRGYDNAPWPESTQGPLVNSHGSRNQVFEHVNDAEKSESSCHFWIAQRGERDTFVKKFVHSPISADQEYAMGKQVNQKWAIQPIGYIVPGDTLEFPYLQNTNSIVDFVNATEIVRSSIGSAICDIFNHARQAVVDVPSRVLLQTASTRKLIDSVDLNYNNFLITESAGTVEVHVVDFEPISVRYRARNNLHQAGMLWSLQYKRHIAIRLFLFGMAGMLFNSLYYQLNPFKQRVIERQPSMFSYLVAEFRSKTGRIFGAILRPFGFG